MNVTEAKRNIVYEVVQLHLDEQAKKRLLYLGIYPGAELTVERTSRKERPLTLLVCGNFLMLRYQDCERIEVKQK